MKSKGIGTGTLPPAAVRKKETSISWKKLGFALGIIVCLAALLAMAGVGFGGLGMDQHWWKASGLLSHLTQAESITMIAAGGGGLLLSALAAIIIPTRKNQPESVPIENDPLADDEYPNSSESEPINPDPIDDTSEEETLEAKRVALLAEKKQAQKQLLISKKYIEGNIETNSEMQKSCSSGLTQSKKTLASHQQDLSNVHTRAEEAIPQETPEREKKIEQFIKESEERLKKLILKGESAITFAENILRTSEETDVKLSDQLNTIVLKLKTLNAEIEALES